MDYPLETKTGFNVDIPLDRDNIARLYLLDIMSKDIASNTLDLKTCIAYLIKHGFTVSSFFEKDNMIKLNANMR